MRWTLLTTIGLAGGLVAALLIGMPLGPLVGAMVITAIATCLVGAVLGGTQAIYLRRLLAKPMWWIVSTTIGTGVGLAAGVVIIEQTGILITGHRPNVARLDTSTRALSFVVLGLICGVTLGIAQGLVLRRQTSRVRHWVPASAFGLAIAFAASSLLVDASGLRFASLSGVTTFVLLAGLAFGALTSLPLRNVNGAQ